MSLSVLDLFSIGIGPSSSHTVGPMRAAKQFIDLLAEADQLHSTARLKTELFGSLGATGRGHSSDSAVLLGLEGEDPQTVDTIAAPGRVRDIVAEGRLRLAGEHEINFDRETDLILHMRKSLPAHPNGMTFTAFAADGTVLAERSYYSIGGGFVVDGDASEEDTVVADQTELPYPFSTGDELLEVCTRHEMTIPEVMAANEEAWRPAEQTREALLHIWSVMQECVENGSNRDGVLPGNLMVPRRAANLKKTLEHLESMYDRYQDPMRAMEWVNLYALAVNEENASGGRIVTAPTNGAAGIIPAVLHYYWHFVDGATEDGIVDFLLTAGAIGILFKLNASISGAEVGCQGEVGSACAMAAGALCQVLGGSPEQVENAAEIGIEHNLGLTCDPVGGLVQIPCIERNAMASIKAINAARLSIHGDGSHKVSLDVAIKTMKDTGADMKKKYKETSRGGLAVNVIEC
ncbi:L-serine ammonia-lyase [Micrococcoides hystricis]|uniref:L-serine dehydratase n=1 Tax=Micrococcoides hystricis TaxID=1572761 RepID=A0ABV6P9U5_9MICC